MFVRSMLLYFLEFIGGLATCAVILIVIMSDYMTFRCVDPINNLFRLYIGTSL